MKGLLVSFSDATYLDIHEYLSEMAQDLWVVERKGVQSVEVMAEENNFGTHLQLSLFVYCQDWDLYNHLAINPPSWINHRYLILMVPEPCPVEADVVHFEKPSKELLLGLGGSVDEGWALLPVPLVKRDVVSEVVEAMNQEGKSFTSKIHPLFYDIPTENRQQTRTAVNTYMLGGRVFPKNLPPRLLRMIDSEEANYLRVALAHATRHGHSSAKKEFPNLHPHDLSYFTSRNTK